MKLPRGENAIVDIEKLRDYCLSTTHPDGRHKARVFRSSLGLTLDDAHDLQALLRIAAAESDVLEGPTHSFGVRYILDFELKRGDKVATIRSRWLIRNGEVIPRLLTCYVLRKKVLQWQQPNS